MVQKKDIHNACPYFQSKFLFCFSQTIFYCLVCMVCLLIKHCLAFRHTISAQGRSEGEELEGNNEEHECRQPILSTKSKL